MNSDLPLKLTRNYRQPLIRRVAVFAIVYLIAYLGASFLDLYTTRLALRQSDAREGNVYANNEGGYSSGQAWLITGLAAVLVEGFLIFGLVKAPCVSPHWLRHPVRSFGKFYVIPWTADVIDRSPLHMLSFAIAFVPLRLLAAANNLIIPYFGIAPLGSLVGRVSERTSATAGFWLVLGPLYCLLGVACSPLAAYFIRRYQEGGGN